MVLFYPRKGREVLRITKQADYGIVLLSVLARAEDRWLTASELAGESRLPQPTVRKVLKIMTRSGLLESHRGAHGGYSLASPAEDVTVVEIIGALDGPIAITECIDSHPGDCSQDATCPVAGNWERINRAIYDALKEITLAEMARVATPSPGLVTLGSGASPVSAEVR